MIGLASARHRGQYALVLWLLPAAFVVIVALVVRRQIAPAQNDDAAPRSRPFHRETWFLVSVFVIVGFGVGWWIQDRLLQGEWTDLKANAAEGLLPAFVHDKELSFHIQTFLSALMGSALAGALAALTVRMTRRHHDLHDESG